LTASIFMSELQRLLGDPALLKAMGQAAAAFAKPDAAQVLATGVLELV
jgi:UDP-N-acetylglucosamine:LPS N-acetylglucosamine transferase